MRKIFSFVTVLFLILNLAGCFQVSTLVKVRPDGSGTLEETVLMRKELLGQMKAMGEQMGDKDTKEKDKETPGMLSEEALRKKANELGEGVTYVSSKKVTTEKFEGYKAVYSFKDINKLKFNQNPSGSIPGSQSPAQEEDGKKESVVFKLTKGDMSRLIITMPENEPADKPGESKGKIKKDMPDDPNSEALMAQMKELFEGMKMGLEVEVMGAIVQTNATHRDGSKVILMDIDLGKLFEQKENLKKFSAQKPDTIEDAKKLMKDIPGIKVELNKEVTIEFR